ncbi:D-aspartate oxidase [Chelonus insularis]|uniref:D-aspartate oxidase n=1 Tax=Chelonus insularis TaxID=460826 RepID=UPI00158E200C|nr:D-aspartate oxidase [Chelonus insularis]
MKVAVVGGGIVGLTTAIELNKYLRNSDITVVAADYDDIVSYVAAGLFRVGHSYSGPTEEITKKWISDSYSYYDNIRNNYKPIHSGITQSAIYMYSNSNADVVKNPLMESVVPIYRNIKEDEFNLVGGKWSYGSYYTTLIIQSKYHLPWVKNQLKEKGTSFVTKKLESLKELVDDYDLIFNCSGLGARKLCNDRKMIPIRGQVIRVQAPWIKAVYYGELDTYIIPGVDGTCTLGGTRNFESTRTAVCPYEAESIRERCEEMLPSLTMAKTLDYAVGHRPHREGGVRVEVEKISNDRRKVNVVHNYGHGGYGVTTAPGTAKYAIELARDYHKISGSKL